MSFFNRTADTIFLKEDSPAAGQLEQLENLRGTLNTEGLKILERDIKFLKYGIAGEENIAFELKNSHLFMYVLKDVYLEFDGLSAQIDYMVFTRKHCYVIECKNLFGNIEVSGNGEFKRIITYNGQTRKEGMYSPITQNQRHLDLIKKIIVHLKNNIVMKYAAEKYFDENYKPIVVLANPKTIINTKYAKKDIKNKVIRADQLIQYIKDLEKQSDAIPFTKNQVAMQAQAFLNLHTDTIKDYTKKYDAYKLDSKSYKVQTKTSEQIMTSSIKVAPVEVPTLVEPMLEVTLTEDPKLARLHEVFKNYRLLKSRDEKIKPYYIFTNTQLDELVSKLPRTKQDLIKLDGFGKVKVEKYGDEILTIITKYFEYIK